MSLLMFGFIVMVQTNERNNLTEAYISYVYFCCTLTLYHLLTIHCLLASRHWDKLKSLECQ